MLGYSRLGRKQQETKMATQDRSPSLFLGQSWTSWADKMSITDGNEDEEDDTSDAKDEGDSMKLNKKDMDLFGFCPSREDFTLALCEICSMLVKPQALKRHMEMRHGPVASITATLDEQAATSKALNSELAKTLSMPVAGFSKTSATAKPPTKASLKQVPSSVRNPGSAAGGNSKVNSTLPSSSRQFAKANTNPVVKMERIPKEVASLKKAATAPTPESNSPLRDVIANSPIPTVTAALALGRNIVISTADGDKTLTNGALLKKAMITSTHPCLTAPTTCPVTITLATLPLALTTTTTSVTYTRPMSATLPTTTATTTFALLSKNSKPVRTASLSSALAATLTAAHNTLRPNPQPITTSSKSKKSPKERKFLPCKDREFDANKHCGVKLDESGKPCTRSLTCKTHALGLRRAVPGRKKSFDDLLREHKAAKEALLKAKAEEQAAHAAGVTLVTNSAASTAPQLVTAVTSPAALAAVSAIKLGHPDMSGHRDIKVATSTLLPHPGLHRVIKPQRPAVNSAVFQKFVPGGSFPPSLTIKEEPSPIMESPSHSSQPIEKDREALQDKPDVTYISHQPRPAAVCNFGARMAGGGCALFSRKTDLVRAAFLSALERQLNPPPHKKLCVESKLPKEPQMSSNSKDPYEFNTVDSGLAHQRPTVSFTIGGPVNANSGLLGKPLLKHKTKSLSSHSLSVSGLAMSSGVSATATPTTIAIPTLAAALLKPTKGHETLTGNGNTGLQRGTLTLSQGVSSQNLKRKRSGSTQAMSGIAHSVPTSTLQFQGGVGLTVTTAQALGLADGGRTSQQQQSAVLTPASGMNSQSATTPLTAITIPSVNLANAATLGLSATLPNSKQQGQKGNIIKDFNFVLTGIDPLVNGQYVNITGAQLAELAAAQAMNATVEDKNIKRSHLAKAKHGAHKISGTLETLRALQGNSVLTAVPQNAVLVDGSLQGAVLAPVSSLSGGGGGGGNSTYVALSSNALTSNQSSTSVSVAPNTIFRTVSESGTPQQVTLSSASFTNGIISSSGDKLHVAAAGHHHQQQHHHHHRIANHVQGRAGTVPTAKTLQASGLLQGQGTQICPSPTLAQLAHFKPGTFNITKAGKITMQPVSVTIPLVSQMGLGTLAPSQQQNPHSHTQPTLLVTSTANDVRAASGPPGTGKTEIHLQPQISSTSSGVIS